jgi:branched-chain amino acid aminotransferase
VAETNATHVFLVDQGVVRTSRLVACPEGITRAVVLDICHEAGISHEEKDLSLTEVYRADEMFCTGTMGELAPVVKVDGRTIGTGSAGPITRRLMELFRQRTENEGDAVT